VFQCFEGGFVGVEETVKLGEGQQSCTAVDGDKR
jgi:hypothetical protein